MCGIGHLILDLHITRKLIGQPALQLFGRFFNEQRLTFEMFCDPFIDLTVIRDQRLRDDGHRKVVGVVLLADGAKAAAMLLKDDFLDVIVILQHILIPPWAFPQ